MNITKNFYRIINWFFDKPKFFGSIVFTTLSFLFIYIAFQNYKISKEDKKTEMTNTLNVISKNIEQLLKNSYTTTLTLALTINDEGIPQDFDLIAKQLLESNNSISAVELVPNGVIKYIYPLEENKAALNLDILNAELFKKEALKSIKTKKIYFAGPFELTQGGQGIVGRLPIFVKNKFWGFSAVVISLDKLLKTSGIQSIKKENFYFQLSKVNPNTGKEVFYLPESIKPEKNNYVKRYIPDGDWNLYIIDKDSNALLKLFLIKILISILVAFTIGYFMFMLLEKPKELKYLIQSQAKKLIKTELKFKAIFDQAAIGIVNVDAETKKIIDVNERFCNLLGYTVDEMREMNFQEITHPDDIEKSLKNVESIKKGITDEYTFEKRYLSKEGKIIWANLTITRFEKNDNSEATTLIALIQDITELKKNKGLIINSQQRIESLINTIDGIVWECDARTFEFSFISKKVENILGYTAEEWLSNKTFWQDHIYIEDKNETIDFCLNRTRASLDHDFEYRMVAKDGRIVWLRDIVNVVTENNKPSKLRGIMINITKTKEIENDLNNSFDLVTTQNKRLLNFSYIVSHNLRSHTSNISSLIELIETTEDEHERNEMIGLLKTVSNSLNETLTNLNEVVNIQTNIGLITEKINLKSYIKKSLKIFEEQIKLNEVIVNNLVSDDVEIIYNPAYLESILYNIISNAIRYRKKDIKSNISIKCYNENNEKVIEIADNGIGIDLEKNSDKIFGMYKTFSSHNESRGLGLFITKSQIDAMGGKITVESEPNVGTIFKIFI